MSRIFYFALLVIAVGCSQASPPREQTSSPSTPAPAAKEAAAPKKEYGFRGKVESVDAKAGTLSVTNEPIDGWMGAMTMVYRVDNKDVLEQIKQGSQITAKVYDGDFQTLYSVQLAPAAPVMPAGK
jgi:Cu/Ag efflux protein CusF